MKDLMKEIDSIFDEIVEIRRDIHAHPEMGQKETRTTKIIADKLREYGVDEVIEGATEFGTGVIGLIKGTAGPGKCLAMRADIDALPIQEDTGLPFSSTVPNVMHACCHDGHTASLLGAAKVLVGMRDELHGSVKLLFQPSEEQAPKGGAKPMVDAGALENPHVDAAISCHLYTGKTLNEVQLYKGPFTTAFDLYDIEFIGKSGHGSQPHTAKDAILAACQYVVMLQQVVSRKVDPLKTAIISAGLIEGGKAVNIIPDYAKVGMVARAYDEDTRNACKQQVYEIADGIAKLSGCEVKVTHMAGYPSVFNDPELVDLIEEACTATLGADRVTYLDTPLSGSEDFSYFGYHTGVPLVQVVIAAGHLDDEIFPLHHPKTGWKEETMKTAIAFFVATAAKYLG